MNATRHRIVAAFAVVSLWIIITAVSYGQAATRYMGAVTAISGNKITIKTAQGEDHQVQVPGNAEVKRIEPGQTNLNAAVAMRLNELATGDRVLVWIDPAATSATPQALRIVAIKATDLAKKRQQDLADWQQNGVSGLVKTIDQSTGTIEVTSGAGVAAKTITIHTDKSTVLKRYAHDSETYADAEPAPFSAIQEGDQLMARGKKDPASGEVTAAEVVSGSFLNISGLVSSLDPATQTFVIKDLATKKQFTVKVSAKVQMRRVPANVAQMVAARLKGTTSSPENSPAQNESPTGRSPENPSAGETQRGSASAAGTQRTGGAWSQRNGSGAPASNDPQQMLTRTPAITFSDLKDGEAVMLVASSDDSSVSAITLLAGVEPLLEAPASQNLLANWSMGSGGGEGGEN